jgi:hypothetical protein
MKHIEIETLINKFEGQLTADDERGIAAHLAECAECLVEEAKLGHFFSYAEKHVVGEVPQAVTARILNLYQRKPGVSETRANGFSKIASLIFDDWQMALNERYAGSETRQMLYRVGDFDVDLRLEFVGEMCRLTGQVFPRKVDAAVELASPEGKTTAKLNEFGEFAFDLVAGGDYDLNLLFADEVLSIGEIPLHQ